MGLRQRERVPSAEHRQDKLLRLAILRRSPGPVVEGLSAFIVERDSPGLRAGARLCTGGLRTAVCSDLLLEECRVPQENLVGPEGEGGGPAAAGALMGVEPGAGALAGGDEGGFDSRRLQ